MRAEMMNGTRPCVCWLCGEAIDLSLHHYDRRSFTADHKLSLEDYPELAEVYSNLEPAHRGCNSRKGKGMEQYPPTGTQIW
jgi:5-methylcytosine-specific restriction endonuclease McrA